MKTRTLSVLGSAALVLVVVGLAMWVVSLLTDSGAAAERLPLIVVGASSSAMPESTPGSAGENPAGSATPSSGGTTLSPGSDPGGIGTQVTTPSTATTPPGPQPGSTTTIRIVVPDPVRERARGDSGAGSQGTAPSGDTSGGGATRPSGSDGSGGLGTGSGSGTAGGSGTGR